MTDEPQDYELLMPFVTVASRGGPHDDAAYVAGWEMANLSARLRVANAEGLDVPDAVIRRDNLPQVSLIAMHHGFTDTECDFDDADDLDDDVRAEWARVVFTRAHA